MTDRWWKKFDQAFSEAPPPPRAKIVRSRKELPRGSGLPDFEEEELEELRRDGWLDVWDFQDE